MPAEDSDYDDVYFGTSPQLRPPKSPPITLNTRPPKFLKRLSQRLSSSSKSGGETSPVRTPPPGVSFSELALGQGEDMITDTVLRKPVFPNSTTNNEPNGTAYNTPCKLFLYI